MFFNFWYIFSAPTPTSIKMSVLFILFILPPTLSKILGLSAPTCCCSIAKLCSTLYDPMNSSMPGFPVLHYLLEFAQTHGKTYKFDFYPHLFANLLFRSLGSLTPRWHYEEHACQCRSHKRYGFYPWVGKIPWRRKWQPTAVFLPGEFHGQRSLVSYSP